MNTSIVNDSIALRKHKIDEKEKRSLMKQHSVLLVLSLCYYVQLLGIMTHILLRNIN